MKILYTQLKLHMVQEIVCSVTTGELVVRFEVSAIPNPLEIYL